MNKVIRILRDVAIGAIVILGGLYGSIAIYKMLGPKTFEDQIANCLSGDNGSSLDLIFAMKTLLRDPDSFQHVKTTYIKNNAAEIDVTMRFRSNNGFGGKELGEVSTDMSIADCEFKRMSVRN